MKRLILLCTVVIIAVAVLAQGDSGEARRTFEKAYNQVFGPQGCSLSYDVNLVGVYKTAGTIWIKGKKSKFSDAKVDSWSDGKTKYTVYRKKKNVEITDATKRKQDKYADSFKFTLDDFDYSMEHPAKGNTIMITLKQKRKAKGTVKHAKVLLDAKTLAPKHIKVKVALFWANIAVSNFKSGGISDNVFVFPREQYSSGYTFVNKR